MPSNKTKILFIVILCILVGTFTLNSKRGETTTVIYTTKSPPAAWRNNEAVKQCHRGDKPSSSLAFCSPCKYPSTESPCEIIPGFVAPSLDTSGITMIDLLRTYRHADATTVFNAEINPVVCILALFHAEGVCRPDEESLEGCLNRVGFNNVEKVLPDMCIQRKYWQSLKSRLAQRQKRNSNQIDWKTLPRGYIPESTVRRPSDRNDFVEVSKRTYANFGDPLVCPKSKVTIHPIGFGIPASIIAKEVPRTKAFDFMPLVPGKHMGDRNYKTGIAQEAVFRELYSASYFAFTNNRGGWDCMRHYEALASGAVLFFPELPIMPKYTLTHLPRALLQRAIDLPGVQHIGTITDPKNISADHEFFEPILNFHTHFKKPGTIDIAKFDKKAYWNLADDMLKYTQRHLTCGAIVASLLKTMNAEGARKVLLVTRFAYDYLHLTIQTGFDELGLDLTIVGEDARPWMYRLHGKATNDRTLSEMSEVERGEALQRFPTMYGQGFSFLTRGLGGDKHEYITNKTSTELSDRIAHQEFDAAVYTYIHAGMVGRDAYLNVVPKYYGFGEGKKPLAFLDFDDANFIGPHEYKKLALLGHVFSREIQTDRSCI